MTKVETFLTTFNLLEKHLRSIHGATKHTGFKRLVDKLSKSNSLVALYQQDLIEFVELRNAVVHRSTGQPIADPHQEAVDRIQQLYQHLVNPPTAADIANQPVFTCQIEMPIATLVRSMQENSYVYVPVYQGKIFVGVFSENTLTKWLASVASGEEFLIKSKTVGELSDFFDQENDKFNSYRFVSEQTDAFSVREDFVSFLSQKKRLGAVFLTQNGNPTEKITGIITAWDIPKLAKYSAPRNHATR
jgi:predicted transcriptional regulator